MLFRVLNGCWRPQPNTQSSDPLNRHQRLIIISISGLISAIKIPLPTYTQSLRGKIVQEKYPTKLNASSKINKRI
ncbi:hypothetical protein PIROE2DRAFT_8802 [Piromyces sp. E2]|nr:hypothetical protein PIROE2DRAFT_8802 [Piromyces sp. E2]|eukprot:OUM64415.1 hypothetical protein PIROE2DRAFT_8802 [Piromyces sp. E2]